MSWTSDRDKETAVAKTEDAQHDAVLRLECDARTGEYTLTIEYRQTRPPAEHAKIHGRLLAEARQWLLAAGIKPDLVEIKFEGCLEFEGQWNDQLGLLSDADRVNAEEHPEEDEAERPEESQEQQRTQDQEEQDQSQ